MGLEIIGAALQHRASKDAASAQKEAAYEANQTARDLSAEQMELYKQIYNEQKAQQAPAVTVPAEVSTGTPAALVYLVDTRIVPPVAFAPYS
jgi:hypothetical protein